MCYASRSVIICLVALTLLLGGCKRRSKPTGVGQPTSTTVQSDPGAVLAQLKNGVFSMGPNGESPERASSIKLSDDELTRIRSMHATAAIVFHYSGNDWSNAQLSGLRSQFGIMGVEIIAVTDAGFKPEKQVSDIETVLVKKPSIIVSIPTDPIATADAYRKAAARGVKLVFMDNVPKGLIPGKDYISVVSADNYGNGVAAAALTAQALGGKGNIGLIYHGADFFVTRERYEGFKNTVAKDFPQMKIIAEEGIGGPDFAGDGERAASAMITSHRNLDAIWAVWDVPAEGAVAAARTAGRDKLVVTTCDLGQNVAINMAQSSFVKGLGAQRPFDQGVTEAMLAGYALLGKKAPPYVALPALPITRDNLLESWKLVYHQEAPADVKNSMR